MILHLGIPTHLAAFWQGLFLTPWVSMYYMETKSCLLMRSGKKGGGNTSEGDLNEPGFRQAQKRMGYDWSGLEVEVERGPCFVTVEVPTAGWVLCSTQVLRTREYLLDHCTKGGRLRIPSAKSSTSPTAPPSGHSIKPHKPRCILTCIQKTIQVCQLPRQFAPG